MARSFLRSLTRKGGEKVEFVSGSQRKNKCKSCSKALWSKSEIEWYGVLSVSQR